ncbi:unnamed protein product [Hydatigera taeniaeformis]|uniref:DUF5641 domain-containing protein n=1 Tax=Hydatigena taeniaeformis TaxID=6205 RepID=A0A0R3WX10_HYDTA|nr:unnamed protein product [Hydatigera taeniaeformis]
MKLCGKRRKEWMEWKKSWMKRRRRTMRIKSEAREREVEALAEDVENGETRGVRWLKDRLLRIANDVEVENASENEGIEKDTEIKEKKVATAFIKKGQKMS